MTNIYIVMLDDRHVDPEPFPFTTYDAAKNYVTTIAADVRHPESIVEYSPPPNGWLYLMSYNGNYVWIVEKEMGD